MKKYILTILLILAVSVSFGQSDPAPSPPANPISIQGFAKINGVDTVHTGYQSGFGFFDIAGRSWTKKNFVAALIPTTVKTAAYTAAVHDLVPVNTTSGSVTITLPPAPPDRSQIAIKHIIQGAANTVTINASGTDVFNKSGGATSLILKLVNQGVILQYSSAGIWYVLTDDLPLTGLDLRYANTLTTAAGSAPTLINGVLNIPPAVASAGTVTNVSSANSDISVANGTSAPVLTLNSGTGVNQIVKRDGSGNLNATTVTTNASLTGPVTSIGNATTIASINGITPSYYDPTSSIQTQLNSKQGNLTLTTTGATGTAATLSGSTLNIPTPSLTYGSYTQNSLGQSLADAILIQNTTVSTSSLNQNPPALDYSGTVWKASASQPYHFYLNTTSSYGTPYFQLSSSLNGSAAGQISYIDINGNAEFASVYTPGSCAFGGIYVQGGAGYNFTMPNISGGFSTSNSADLFGGASTVVPRMIFGSATGTDVAGAGQNLANAIFRTTPTYAGGVVNLPWIANVVINANAFAASAYPGSSVTNNANLYINSPSAVATNNYPLYVAGGTSYFGGAISVNATKTVINGSTGGTAEFSESQVGSSDKRVNVYLNAISGGATYTFPTAFINTPVIIGTNGPASSIVTSLSTTAVTITGSSNTGTIIIEGY